MLGSIPRKLLKKVEESFFGKGKEGSFKDIMSFLNGNIDVLSDEDKEFFSEKISYAVISSVYSVVKDYIRLPIDFFFDYSTEIEEIEVARAIFLDKKLPESEFVIADVSFAASHIYTERDLYNTITYVYDEVKKGIKEVYSIKLPEVTRKDLEVAAKSILSFPRKPQRKR